MKPQEREHERSHLSGIKNTHKRRQLAGAWRMLIP